MKKLVGLCSICGGSVFHNFGEQIMGVEPPLSCSQCGATQKRDLPIIAMNEEMKPQLLVEIWD